MCRPSTPCSVWPKKHSLIVGMQKLTLLREENVPCLGNCLTSKSAPTSKSTTSTKSESFSCEINLENKWIWLAFQSEYVVVNLGRIVHLEPTLESLNPWCIPTNCVTPKCLGWDIIGREAWTCADVQIFGGQRGFPRHFGKSQQKGKMKTVERMPKIDQTRSSKGSRQKNGYFTVWQADCRRWPPPYLTVSPLWICFGVCKKTGVLTLF